MTFNVDSSSLESLAFGYCCTKIVSSFSTVFLFMYEFKSSESIFIIFRPTLRDSSLSSYKTPTENEK